MKPHHTIATCLLIITLFVSPISASAQNHTGLTCSVLPAEVNSELFFGMNLADVQQLLGSNFQSQSNSLTDFRLVYLQKTYLREISSIVYYFDNENNKPLYEVIINYQNEEQAQKAATHLFGNPNYKQTDWRIKMQGVPDIWSWVYKNKLVVAAKIPGSEWAEEWDK